MPSTRSSVATLATVCALVLTGCGAKPAPQPPQEEGAYYVALGDSFTAVAGRGSVADKICERSSVNYPALLAEAEKFEVADVSCGGAKPDELTQAQGIAGRGTNQPQLSAITPETRLVTLGIGLNETLRASDGSGNTEISYLLTEICGPKNRQSPPCQTYMGYSDAKWKTEVIEPLGEEVAVSFRQIRERAPKARIVFVGYPRVLPESGPCARVVLPAGAFERLRTTMAEVNRVLKKVAAEADVEYVDMYAASAGHDACSDDPWVNGTKQNEEAEAFHPYKSYHRAVAAKLEALLKTEPRA